MAPITQVISALMNPRRVVVWLAGALTAAVLGVLAHAYPPGAIPVVVCVAVALLVVAVGSLSVPSNGGMAVSSARTIRTRDERVFVSRQHNPDAAGRPRPRAPGAVAVPASPQRP
jgi:hypothetical protein